MAHLPINHPARPFYRVVAGAIGLYIFVFGIVGFVQTQGMPFFDQGRSSDHWALGLTTNPAFSILSIVAGAVIAGVGIYGRNLDHFVNLYGSGVFVVAGVFMMTLLRTDANFLNFTMRNCVVSFLIGIVLMLAGLYGKVGSHAAEVAEDRFRHGEASATTGSGESAGPA